MIAKLDAALSPVEGLANLLRAFAIFLLTRLGVAQIVMRTVFNAPIAFAARWLRLERSIRLFINLSRVMVGVATDKDVAGQAQDDFHEAMGGRGA